MNDESSRQLIESHFAAFNRHDPTALFEGLTEDVLWATGTDVFNGKVELTELFDDWLWSTQRRIDVMRLIADGDHVAAECVEHMTLDRSPVALPMGVFFEVRDGLIRSVKVFREGSSDVGPVADPAYDS